MIAGPFNLATYDEAELTFDMWLDTELYYDGLLFGASTDGSLFTLTGWTGYTGAWEPMTVDMADLYEDGTVDFTGESQVWIIFVFDSDISDSNYEGAYVDDVRLTGTTAGTNTAPVAVADSYQTDQDTPLVRSAPGVLGNDTDADGDPLTASKVANPSHGSVTLNSNGSFTYTPAAGYYGTDSFTYRAYDGKAYSNTVSVTITINEAEGPLPPVLNVAGDTRFETAVEASKLAYPKGAQTVVIATGRNWPDALGGSALAGALGGPILLTEPGSLPPAVAAEITRLKATRAVILGGTAAVGPAVQNTLASMLTTVERIDGNDRYETANKVAARVKTEMGGEFDGTAFLATGGNFPDALAAAPLAAGNKWPLYLSHPTAGVSAATRAAMSGVTKVIILGGTAAIPQAVQDGLSGSFSVSRIAGTTRYDTAAQVAQYGVTSAGHMWNRVGVATGENYPDALAGGVLQGKVGSVMLLTPTASLCTEAGYKLLNNRNDITTVTFFGGTGAVSQTTRTSVLSALAGTWTPPQPPQPPPTGTDGLWQGYTTGYPDPVVQFNVKDGKITTTGSTLEYGASMIVVYPYSNVTMTTYFYADIPIGADGKFAYTTGTVTTMGGQKWVSGTITSATHATGTATHSENSGYLGFTGNLTYDWTADR